MTTFKSSRVAHEFTQTNPAAPEKVFPLLCPVREADWLPGWRYRLIYSDSGFAELGCVFTTPNAPAGVAQSESRGLEPANLLVSGGTQEVAPFPKPSLGTGSASAIASETTWIVSEFDPAAFRVGFVWIKPGMIITEIRIRLVAAGAATTQTHIRYRYTGLSPEGNREIKSYDWQWFERKMQGWETTMNHYLHTGHRIAP